MIAFSIPCAEWIQHYDASFFGSIYFVLNGWKYFVLLNKRMLISCWLVLVPAGQCQWLLGCGVIGADCFAVLVAVGSRWFPGRNAPFRSFDGGSDDQTVGSPLRIICAGCRWSCLPWPQLGVCTTGHLQWELIFFGFFWSMITRHALPGHMVSMDMEWYGKLHVNHTCVDIGAGDFLSFPPL